MNRSLSLEDLLKAGGVAAAPSSRTISTDVKIGGLCYDSRLVKEGDLFFAMKGVHSDGHVFLDEVAKKGAVGAVVEQDVPGAALPIFPTKKIFPVMSRMANAFFHEPSKKIPVIGVTGTNGKTTTTFIIEDILAKAGRRCGVMGTVSYRLGGRNRPAPNTTPFSIDVQAFLAEAVEQKAAAVAMEVSSHALEQHRVDDVRFAVGVFTNLTQDHLDFHGDMDSYFKAKSKLFHRNEPVKAVVNIDDAYGQRLAAELKAPLTFGLGRADLSAREVRCDLNGIHFLLNFPSGRKEDISTNLLGRYNVSNCLAAAGAMLAFGLPEEAIVAGLNERHAVPGRLERVEKGQKFVVAVDYAHTHDAMAQVLSTLRDTGPRRLVCVFGAGGDRDKTKRPKMGRIAVEMADFAFVTSDNPRSEKPEAILKDIEQGIKNTGKTNYKIIENREEAIREAIHGAVEGDIILIAGKGHETYQIYGNQKFHFSDFEVAEKAIGS